MIEGSRADGWAEERMEELLTGWRTTWAEAGMEWSTDGREGGGDVRYKREGQATRGSMRNIIIDRIYNIPFWTNVNGKGRISNYKLKLDAPFTREAKYFGARNRPNRILTKTNFQNSTIGKLGSENRRATARRSYVTDFLIPRRSLIGSYVFFL